MNQRPTAQFGQLVVGPIPRVVGSVSRAETLAGFSVILPHPCELVEVRLDKIGAGTPDWLDRSAAIEGHGLPVILTVRLAAEGGDWHGSDADRADLFAAALTRLAAIDVEGQSRLLPGLAVRARAAQKTIIVSFHDFHKTPSLAELRNLIEPARVHASVLKVATMINSPSDVTTLQHLLEQDWGLPLAVMGMGPEGPRTRPLFASLGSCLAYGYLDQPVAPGQPAAADLSRQLRQLRDR